MGADSPELTLEGVLDFISERYCIIIISGETSLFVLNHRSQASRGMLSQELLLPRTVEELHSGYIVVGGPKVCLYNYIVVI